MVGEGTTVGVTERIDFEARVDEELENLPRLNSVRLADVLIASILLVEHTRIEREFICPPVDRCRGDDSTLTGSADIVFSVRVCDCTTRF